MEMSSDTIERQAVDTSGQLGSLYDASRDFLLENSRITGTDNAQFEQYSECCILSGAETNDVINLLKAIKFDDALLQSILLGIIEPSGISSFINYNQSINENTRFLYYSYRNRQEMLDVTAGQADKIVSLPSNQNNATHMVTKIIWGFEILCVIQNPTEQSANSIAQLLYKISDQLHRCDKALDLTKAEECQINELSDVTIFGSKLCVDDPNASLLTILTRLRGWQRHTTYHVPILYTLYSLKWLYKNQQSINLRHLSDQDNTYIAIIEPTITHLDYCFNSLKQMFKNRPKNLTSLKVDEWLKDIPNQFSVLLSEYEEFRTKLRTMLVDVRRGTCESIEINNVIFDKRYSSLRKAAIDEFHSDVKESFEKIKLIERLNDDKIIYINGLDILQCQSIPLTLQDIHEVLEDYFSKKYTSAILWYSSDRLKREKTNEWEQIYQQLTSEQQSATSKSLLIYVDFTRCHQKLEEFVIRKLPIKSSLKSQHNHPRSKILNQTILSHFILTLF
jgi:hypothetical protein